jgi:hypothetical protein
MGDSLGYRMKFAVVAPSTNTSVQPEYDDMRPRGVTNYFSRISIPDTKVTDDDSLMVMLQSIRDATFEAVDVSMSMEPGCVIMGMSAETFWDGAEGAERLHRKNFTTDQFRDALIEELDVLYEGASSGRIMNVGIHPHVSGRVHRVRALREFIQHAKSLPGVWWATREEIADWYLANHESHIPGQLG